MELIHFSYLSICMIFSGFVLNYWFNLVHNLRIFRHLFGFILFLGLTVANLMEVPQVVDLLGFFTRFV